MDVSFTRQTIVNKEHSVTEKKKIFVISDHPLSPSGVGTQTKYMLEALLKTGRYKAFCLGGAIKHEDYRPMGVTPYGEDWVIQPVDGYGNPDMIRSILRTQKPDVLWFMTDPRFFHWLWEIEDEVRLNVPMVYHHVWDNKPYPTFNERYYSSNDVICTISKVTDDIVRTVAPDVECIYQPHSVNTEVFKKMPEEESKILKAEFFKHDKFIFFYNNRNARRKQTGSLIFWFKDFLDKVGHDKAQLVMHTETRDQHGQDLHAIVNHLGLTNGEVLFSEQKVPPERLAMIYNAVDCTVTISDAEGFGLSTLESLACETPIIVSMTGGLQEQVTDGENWFGIGIEPSSKAIIGSQEIPWIYEDRISGEDCTNAMLEMYNKSKEDRDALGAAGRQHIEKNYNFEKLSQKWVDIIDNVCEKHGSWESRKNYQSWSMEEV